MRSVFDVPPVGAQGDQAHLSLGEAAAALAAAPPLSWPEPGERLDDLIVLRELGRGSFARVYLALEESTGARPVAVKFSPEGDDEARTLGRLAHPNIVPVLSARFEEAVGLTAVCMPFLGAATLIDVMDQAYPTPDAAPPREAAVIREAIRSASCSDDPPPLTSAPPCRPDGGSYADAVARIAWQIADALAFLHKEGVVHRDLKPSNVLLRPDGQCFCSISTSPPTPAWPNGASAAPSRTWPPNSCGRCCGWRRATRWTGAWTCSPSA